jgi:putative transposase
MDDRPGCADSGGFNAAASAPVRRACTLLGRAWATHYRHARGPLHGPRPDRQALTVAEVQAVLTLINTPAWADL